MLLRKYFILIINQHSVRMKSCFTFHQIKFHSKIFRKALINNKDD